DDERRRRVGLGARGECAAARPERLLGAFLRRRRLFLQRIQPTLQLLEATAELSEVGAERRKVAGHALHQGLHPVGGAALPVLDGSLAGTKEILLQLTAATLLAAQQPVEAGLGLLADGGHPRADLLLDEAGERVARAADDFPQHAERHLILLLL